MASVGTGFEKSSYSLQYSQARLQRRIGNDVRQQRMVGRGKRARDHARSPQIAVETPSNGGALSFAQNGSAWFVEDIAINTDFIKA